MNYETVPRDPNQFKEQQLSAIVQSFVNHRKRKVRKEVEFLRNDFFTFVNSSNSNFKELSDEIKFTWLFSQEDKIISLKLANYIQKATLLKVCFKSFVT